MYYQDEDRDTDGDAKNLGHPSSTALDSIRYTYLAITIIVFALGWINFVHFLIKKGRLRVLPLTMMYISGQFTLLFVIGRLVTPNQPAIAPDFEDNNYELYYYLNYISMTGMWCVGLS